MVGYYTKVEPEAPSLVRLVDRLAAHRQRAILAAAGLVGALIGLSIFLPTLGLSLLAVALVAVLVLWVLVRSQSSYRTHWARHVQRR